MVSKKMNIKKIRGIALVLLFSSIMVTSFNNCGQPGSIELVNSDASLNDTLGEPGPIILPPPSSGGTLVPKTSSIMINPTNAKKIDLLIVIDNSGSMKTEQANMASRFASLIDQLSGLDWQLGIVTTDVSADAELKDGRLLEFSNTGGTSIRVLNSTMDIATVKAAFASTIQRTETGSGLEQGIKATYRAVERSQIANDPNMTLFRTDAAMSVVIVSDANETASTYTDKNDPQVLLDYIKTLWPGKPVNFNAIVVKSGDAVCKGQNGNENYGTLYEAIATNTNGIIGDVCATDYAAQLKSIGQTAAALVNTLTLSCAPADINNDSHLDLADIDIRNPNNQQIIGFTIQGAQVKFGSPLLVGTTTAKYYCLQ